MCVCVQAHQHAYDRPNQPSISSPMNPPSKQPVASQTTTIIHLRVKVMLPAQVQRDAPDDEVVVDVDGDTLRGIMLVAHKTRASVEVHHFAHHSACEPTHTQLNKHTDIQTYTHTCTQTYIHTHTHMHTHTHTQTHVHYQFW